MLVSLPGAAEVCRMLSLVVSLPGAAEALREDWSDGEACPPALLVHSRRRWDR